jgi:hypothetical protein
MQSGDIKDLISKRKSFVQTSKENNFNFDSILAGLYNDPSHFIYEILQNAEDAGATEIIFKASRKNLEIIHNGKDFDFDDVKGITGIGISTKKDDINAIGKFGVGFKSVFAITKTPVIHSGNYHFEIDDFVVPSEIPSSYMESTLIILPFNHPTRKEENAYEIVSKKLESLELKTLLFLNNIKTIKWETHSKTGEYVRSSVNKKKFYGAKETTIISKAGEQTIREDFLVLSKPVKIASHNLQVEIAYRVSNDTKKKKIIKEKDTRLVSFFPTEKVTYLNFLVQGPFKTTPNRENIPLEDRQNRLLINATSDLVADSIEIVKSLGLLSVSFLETLPIDRNYLTELIYSGIYNKVKARLLSNKALLPTNNKKFATVKNVLLARGKELPDILNSSDLKIIFKKSEWLDTSITADKTRLLREYLINDLEIKEVDFENLAANITANFIKRKTDSWLIIFYKNLLKQQSLWEKESYYNKKGGVLRRKPIIRLSSREHIEPFDKDGNIQVYLPGESKSKYKTIHESLIKDKYSYKFLLELGISTPDIFSEIKEFLIPKYSQENIEIADEEYYEDIEKLLLAFNTPNPEKKEDLLSVLKEIPIIYCRNSVSGDQFLVNPGESYIPNYELINYFEKFDKVNFISDEFDQKLPQRKTNLCEFFLAVGCENKPRRIRIDSTLTSKEKELLRKRNYESRISSEIHLLDYEIEGLSNFLINIDIEKSAVFWNWLLSHLQSFEYQDKRLFFYGEYKWYYYTAHFQKFESRFLKILKSSKWLYDDSNTLYYPHEVTISILSDKYNKTDKNLDVLTDVLGFQTDEIKRIEEKTGKRVILMDEQEYEEYLAQKKGTDDDVWIPEVEPENIPSKKENLKLAYIETKDLRGQDPDGNEYPGDKDTDVDHEESDSKINSNHLKDIGIWGERYVQKHLLEEYKNAVNVKIVWLNKDENVGKGFDFVVISEGKEIEYIEVKSKTDDSKRFVAITGTQWEFARKLYNEKEGDKYSIYIVTNAGTSNAKIHVISNPVKLWYEGKLYAHPVNLKL